MDCAKGINFLLTNGGEMADYKGFGKATKPMLPSIGVPTTAGTGSEGQSFALIADEKTHLKMACGDRKAAFRVAILDPEVTVSQPPKVTAVTGIDAMSHALESYVTTRRNPLSQTFAREAWRLLEATSRRCCASPPTSKRAAPCRSERIFAGAAIENFDARRLPRLRQSADGPLRPDARHRHRHPAAARHSLQRRGGRRAVRRPGPRGRPAQRRSRAAGEALARRITDLLRIAGLPTRLSECGVSRGIFSVLAEEASQQWTGRFNPRPVDETDLRRLYEAAF